MEYSDEKIKKIQDDNYSAGQRAALAMVIKILEGDENPEVYLPGDNNTMLQKVRALYKALIS